MTTKALRMYVDNLHSEVNRLEHRKQKANGRILRTGHVVDLKAEFQRAKQDSVELSSKMQQYKVQIAENVEQVSQFTEFE